MLLLTATTDKLQLTTSAAATVDVHASYMDHTIATDDVEGGRQLTAITTATTTDILAAPGAGVTRNMKTLHIRNKHATTSCDVTVIFDANGTDYELHKVTLRAGEALEYKEGLGFYALVLATSPAVRMKALTADQSNSTATLTAVSGMNVTTGLGSFQFYYAIIHKAGVTTTGVRFSVNHTGTVTSFVAQLRNVTAATLNSDANPDQDVVTAAMGIQQAFAARAKSTTGWGTTLGQDTADADMLTIIEGAMVVTVDGNIELWHGSETTAISTVKAGSTLLLGRGD